MNDLQRVNKEVGPMPLSDIAGYLKTEFQLQITDLTCWTCPQWQGCVYSFDPYNTDGDCLASK